MYFASGSALFYSLELVFSSYLSDTLKVPSETSAFFKLFFQAIIMFLTGLVLREKLNIDNFREGRKLFFGGVLLYISFILFFSGASSVKPLHLGLLSYIDRVGAIFLAAIFFKEKMTKNIWFGGALILGASLLVVLFK